MRWPSPPAWLRTAKPWTLLLVAWVCLGQHVPAMADELRASGGFNTLVGQSSYSYTGLRFSHSLSDTLSLKSRVTFSFLTFTSENDHRTVHAEAPAVTPLLGIGAQLSADTSFALLGGVRIKETRFFGERPHHRDDTGPAGQIEMDHALTPQVELSGNYSYSSGDDSHYGEAAVTREVGSLGSTKQLVFKVGFEVSGTVGRDFSEERGGVRTEVSHKRTDAALTLSVGGGHFAPAPGSSVAPYVSANFDVRF